MCIRDSAHNAQPTDGAHGAHVAMLRALIAPSADARGAAAAAPTDLGLNELRARQEALARVRERSASVHAYLAESERRTREAESALLAGLGRYAQAAHGAHGACARVQALDELWAQSVRARLELEAKLNEATIDMLARPAPRALRAPSDNARLDGAEREWSSMAREIERLLDEAKRALEVVLDVPVPSASSSEPLDSDR